MFTHPLLTSIARSPPFALFTPPERRAFGVLALGKGIDTFGTMLALEIDPLLYEVGKISRWAIHEFVMVPGLLGVWVFSLAVLWLIGGVAAVGQHWSPPSPIIPWVRRWLISAIYVLSGLWFSFLGIHNIVLALT